MGWLNVSRAESDRWIFRLNILKLHVKLRFRKEENNETAVMQKDFDSMENRNFWYRWVKECTHRTKGLKEEQESSVGIQFSSAHFHSYVFIEY